MQALLNLTQPNFSLSVPEKFVPPPVVQTETFLTGRRSPQEETGCGRDRRVLSVLHRAPTRCDTDIRPTPTAARGGSGTPKTGAVRNVLSAV